ncbi:MAG: ABC transporter transmembrane domain-containing protein, partial [Gemmatimonadales bacterium]
MIERNRSLDQDIIARYTDQPPRLPADLRARIEAAWGDRPIQLYALADLDPSLRLIESWFALGPQHLAIASRPGSADDWDIHSLDRARVQAVRESPGLSGSSLSLLGAPDEPALAVVRYTNRQRRAFENIRFVIEQQLEGRMIEPPDADRQYAESVAGPIKEAQALVAGHRMAVIWRLLAYLRPYRRQVAVGMSAAAVITLVSLVPPYLAGFLIDQVVRPVQDGSTTPSAVATVAWLAVASMAVVYLIRQAGALVRLRMLSMLGEWVSRDLRTELFEHLQRLSLSFYSRKKTG